MIDSTMTKEIEHSYYSREYTNKIQMLRKSSKLDMDQDIEIFWQANTDELKQAISEHQQAIKDKLKKRFINAENLPYGYPEIAKEEFKILEQTGFIYICNPGISF